MPKVTTLLIAIFGALLIGFCAGWAVAISHSETQVQRIVAMSWGDSKYGSALYGAQVFLEPQSPGYAVVARVAIGRGGGYYHDLGELGRVATDKEAVAKWGKIDWREDGLHIGSGTNQYFLTRTRLENHR